MGNSVFSMEKLTSTSTTVPDAGVDNHVPAINAGVGNGKRITGASFLAGIESGQDQVIVHGTQTTKIDANNNVTISGHLKTIVVAGEDRTVTQGRTTTIAPAETVTITGQRTTTITGNDQRTILGAELKTVVAGQIHNEVSSWLNMQGPMKVKVGIVDMGVFAVKGELNGLKASVHGIKTEAVLIKNETIMMALATAMLATLLTLARPKIGVAKPDIGGVSTHAWYVGV